MPLQTFNYAAIPPQANDYSGLANLFSNYYKGYEMGQSPQRLGQEQLSRQLQNSLLGENLTAAQTNNQFLPQEKQLGLKNSQEELAKMTFENMLAKQFGEQQQQAKLESERAHAGQQRASAEHQQEQANQLRNQNKWAELAQNLPNNGVPFAVMPKNEQLAASKELVAQQKFAHGQVKVNKIAQEMRRIIDEHPNLADDFASAIADAGEKPGVFSKIKRMGANKKDLAAFEKFSKLSNDLILQQGESYGKNFTDAKLAILQMAKPNAANTDEANKYLIDKLLHESSPAEDYNKALEEGRKGRYMPQIGMEYYRKQPETPEQKLGNSLYQSLTAKNTVPVTFVDKNGVTKRKLIPEEQVQAALAAGGKLENG